MRVFLLILCSCFVISGCANAMNEKDTIQLSYVDSNVTNKVQNKKQLDDHHVVFIDRPAKSPLQITINDIPTFQSYIDESSDPVMEIERIHWEYLFQKDYKEYIIVEYGCGIKLCSNLFLEYDNGNFRSLYISDASFYQQHEQWDSFVAIRFGQNESNEVVRNQIVVINLQDWSLVSPDSEQAFLNSFEYPITDLKWAGKTLKVSVADVADSSYETLKKWFARGKSPVREVEWSIQ